MRISLFVLLLLTASPAHAQWMPSIVQEGPTGQLEYVSDAEGNRIPDFSHAGYRGGVDLPRVAVVDTLGPGGGDDTSRIQTALDRVSTRAATSNGIRSTLFLRRGTYRIDGTLRVVSSGVVLRGAGAGETILVRPQGSREPVLVVGDPDAPFANQQGNVRTDVVTPVVPFGERTFRVADASAFRVGDEVVVRHPSTEDWLQSVDFGATDTDDPWAPGEIDLYSIRYVTALSGTSMTLDAPVFSRLDRSLSQSYVYQRDRSHLVREVGVEDLQIRIETLGERPPEACDGSYAGPYEDHAQDAIRLVGVEDGWVKGVTVRHFAQAGIAVVRSTRVTVAESQALEPHSCVTGERRYNFEVNQSQLVLFRDNLATHARHAFVGNGASRDNGIVFLRSRSEDALSTSESHRRWGQAFLWDGLVERGSNGPARLSLHNRGSFGSGHGWTCSGCVAWNTDLGGAKLVLQKPPTSQNYAIGTHGGTVTNEGPFVHPIGFEEGTGRTDLAVVSLYERQLRDRTGRTTSSQVSSEPGALRLRAFPQPARGSMQVRVEGHAGAVRLDVFDMLGRHLLALGQTALPASSLSVNTSALSPGVYVLRVETETGQLATAVVMVAR